jgi:hypothetical protein
MRMQAYVRNQPHSPCQAGVKSTVGNSVINRSAKQERAIESSVASTYVETGTTQGWRR